MKSVMAIPAMLALSTYSANGQIQTLTAAGIVNAASYAGGSVSPGEIVTIFGSFPGPPNLVTLQVDARGFVSTNLSGQQVFFDGVAAPMIYAMAGQASVVVPYAVSGKSSTQVQVSYQGQSSNTVTIPVSTVAPGIFTISASGTGQGAILNQDGTVNSPNNPAAPGSFVSVYGTGEGQTDPPGVDGKPTGSPLPRPIATPIAAMIGGASAPVQYAGGAPGFVAGVLQVNVQVPNQGVTAGNAISIALNIGGKSTQMNVTLAISASPAPRIFSLSPSSAAPGQSVAIQIRGLFTNYAQGSTEANFGPGISVGSGVQGGFGSVTVTSRTNATAQLTIDASAALGSRTVTVATGSEQLTLLNKFIIGGAATTISLGNTINVQNLPPPVQGKGTESDTMLGSPSIVEPLGLPGTPVSTFNNSANPTKVPQIVLRPRDPATGPLIVTTQFTALSQNGTEPPDTQIAAGRTRLLEMVNTSGEFFDKAGNPIGKGAFDLGTFFGGAAGQGTDPRVVFDAVSNTYFAAYELKPAGGDQIVLSVATEPGDTWTLYPIANNNMNILFDQPKLGVSNSAVMLSWNSFNNNNSPPTFIGSQYVLVNKFDLLNRVQNPRTNMWGPDSGRFGLMPVTSLSPTSLQYAAYNNSPDFHVMAFSGLPGDMNVSFTDNSFDVGSSSNPPAAQQPGGTTVWKNTATKINNDNRLMSAVWQNDVLWGAFNEGCLMPARSCLRFIDVATSSNSVQTNEQLANSAQDFYYPGVSLTGSGDLIFGYTSSSSILDPTATVEGVAGGVFDGGTGQGLGYQSGSVAYTGNRWGDYSGAAREPDDLNRVWVAQEFAFNSSSAAISPAWSTAVAQVCFSTSFLAAVCPVPPPPSMGPPTGPTITVAATETQTGPDLCFRGTGYTKNGPVTITYSNIPGGAGVGGTQFTADSNGNVGTAAMPVFDTQFDFGGLTNFCSQSQLDGTSQVSITAKDTTSNFQVYTSAPAYLWCAQSLSQSYNGGCH